MSGGPGAPGGDGGWDKQLRSKGLLPAVGVGAVVYFVTGIVSLSTLGLVGVGAGVGYGVGSWIADNYEKKKQESQKKQGGETAELPWALQVSLQQWQAFLSGRAAGQQLAPAQVEQLFAEFAQREPVHARNVQSLLQQGQSMQEASPVNVSPGVHIVPTAAAEV
mmetsp:Transcript_86068/g.184421  ORF Transcript_86068/g.184421 Transcript_86068/m.184421 type:complete len:164 (+) Transcript_86068:81-572(+)